MINLHLKVKDRKEEAKILIKHLKEEDDKEFIVCGDLNSFDTLNGEDVDGTLREALTDVWSNLKGGLAVTSYGSE
jgi:endonuclease/exonuclease/phosphatase family metal-dependent hydrolase